MLSDAARSRSILLRIEGNRCSIVSICGLGGGVKERRRVETCAARAAISATEMATGGCGGVGVGGAGASSARGVTGRRRQESVSKNPTARDRITCATLIRETWAGLVPGPQREASPSLSARVLHMLIV